MSAPCVFHKERTNQEWLVSLRGLAGQLDQQEALDDLTRCLHRQLYNYLRTRRPHVIGLSPFDDMELDALADDMVQTTLEKLVRGNYQLLQKFHYDGSFVGFMIKVAHNVAGQELRKTYWRRRYFLPEPDQAESSANWTGSILPQSWADPPAQVIRHELIQDLMGCIKRLDERRQTALVGLVLLEKSGRQVAEQLSISENAVFILVYRAKGQVRRWMEGLGYDGSVVEYL